ncbi:decaprenyl-phosphate phosphoribosyltransferase [Paenibacillus sp. TRM 82003]|uniref:decaprenyl-phosphate phosphoribosyltransferase n=1 Tax=Kineococcus sp. TRM81007 TaxID=2925831 RepID=UPI001F58817E|nr:decaprenyl-phosphate phosphoribosyltransferase [Kineococcus sp. TRM81007]MCI2238204.1 decaprenyl-phosphate phosphoribosyltransferase [Kineococcus sp. TRM81007]MCI3924545.1 decaprenyl-phosphate phosphoribosyltransferase [Paenibacillus sp. TRM 82003]
MSGAREDTGAPVRVEGTSSRLPAWLRAMRPHQWVKNVLVLAPVFPAGPQVDGGTLVGVAVAFGLFCLISSSIYLINDARDVEADRAHPRKRFRPIAAGELGVRTAVVLAVVLAATAITCGVLWQPSLGLVLGVYFAVQLAYCFGLKHEPVLELGCVASGFLLRMLAGGTAGGIPLSGWFLLTAAFGSLFMAAGKRYGEARRGELTGESVRRVVQKYSTTYLRFVWTLAATIAVATYALWAVEVLGRQSGGSPVAGVSLVPFVLAVLRYAIDVDRGAAEEPEDIALHDRVLLVLAVLWVASLLLAVWL